MTPGEPNVNVHEDDDRLACLMTGLEIFRSECPRLSS
jgi:hypothetical protein